MIITPDKKNQDLLGTIVEFAYAEYGSALEMLKAAKDAKSPNLKLGYIRHALDEYRHAGLLFEVLSNQVKNGKGEFKKEYRFSPQNVILKGYVDKEGFLVEKLSLKKFVEFVYSNEYLAKQSFDYLAGRIKDSKSIDTIKNIVNDELSHADNSLETLDAIQKDELTHFGMAKKFYISKFPEARLQFAFKREKLKNKFRLFYFKNLRILNKIFDPILNFFIYIFGKIVNLISFTEKNKRNLMSYNSESVL